MASAESETDHWSLILFDDTKSPRLEAPETEAVPVNVALLVLAIFAVWTALSLWRDPFFPQMHQLTNANSATLWCLRILPAGKTRMLQMKPEFHEGYRHYRQRQIESAISLSVCAAILVVIFIIQSQAT